MEIITHFPDHKTKLEEDEDDSLSLRDFPLSCDAQQRRESSSSSKVRRSSSEPSEFFEFFNDFSTSETMSSAEDIIFRGRLVPYQNPPRFHPQIIKSLSADDATHSRRKCCGSTRLDSFIPNADSRLTRHKRPRESSSLTGKADVAKSNWPKISKPRWFVMMFGPLRLQPEMDLRDMKSRQVRRSPGSLFPGEKAAPAGTRRSFWRCDLLRVLSCKTHASVAVTTSIGFMPHF